MKFSGSKELIHMTRVHQRIKEEEWKPLLRMKAMRSWTTMNLLEEFRESMG